MSQWLRIGVLMLWLTAVSGALADRLLRIPTAMMLPAMCARVEIATDTATPHDLQGWLQCGITDSLEIGATYTELASGQSFGSLNVEFNISPVVPALLPGLSVGVSDILGTAPYGTGYYVVITHTVIVDGPNSTGRDFVFHLGAGAAGIHGLFVGFELPLAPSLTLIAEHDSRRVNAAIEWQPYSPLRLRAYVLDDRLNVGASVTLRF